MKTLLTLTSCLLLSLCAKSQDTVFRFSLKEEASFSKALVIPSTGEDKHVCLVLNMDRHLVFLLLDSNFKVTGQFDRRWRGLSDLFLTQQATSICTRFENDAFQYFFTIQPPHNPVFLCRTTIDFQANATEERPFMNYMSLNPTLGYFFDSNKQPYALALNRKDARLYIHRLISFDTYQNDSVDISSISDPAAFFGFVHYVSDDQPQQLNNTAERTLAFVRGNQLLLLSHEYGAPLHLSIIDLTTFQAHFKDLSTQTGFDPIDPKVFYNVSSSVLDDKLFILRSSLDKAELGVFQIPSLALLKHQALATFLKLPARYKTGGPEEGEPVASAEYIKDLTTGPTGLAVCKNPAGDYVLTIGAYTDRRHYLKNGALPDYYDDGKLGVWEDSLVKSKYGVPYQNYTSTPFSATSEQAELQNQFTPEPLWGSSAPNNGHSLAKDPPRVSFKATLAKIALDPTTLNTVQTTDLPDGNATLVNRLEPAKGVTKTIYTFQVGGKQYAAGYNKTTRMYCIWELR